jgi:hypothetical protein
MLESSSRVYPLLTYFAKLVQMADFTGGFVTVGGIDVGKPEEIIVNRILDGDKGFIFCVSLHDGKTWSAEIGSTTIIVEVIDDKLLQVTFVNDFQAPMRWVIKRDLNIFPDLPSAGIR